MKRRTKWILGVGGVVVVAAVAAAVVKGRRPEKVTVWTEKSERKDLQALVTANGTVQAKTKVDLSSNIMGQIVNLAVREGDTVQKGDLLLVINPAQYRAVVDARRSAIAALEAEVARSREAADQARREWERADRQFRDGISPAAEHERAKSNVEQQTSAHARAEQELQRARAELSAASDELGKTEIRAPMGGIVTRRNVEAGEVVVTGTMNNPGTVLMTISDMSTIEAVLEVDQTDVPQLRVGQAAQVLLDAFPDHPFPGVVAEIGSSPIQRPSALSGQPTGTDYEVKVTLNEHPPNVRPGLTVTADIVTDTKKGALAIPIGALVVQQEGDERKTLGKGKGEEEEGEEDPVKSPDEPATVASRAREVEGVFVVEGGKAVFRPVKTGIRGETDLEVREGLKEGEEIVVGPFKALRELKAGKEVKVDATKGAGEAEKS